MKPSDSIEHKPVIQNDLLLDNGNPAAPVSPDGSASAARKALAARARTVSASGDSVVSPCISVCRISADTGLCEGCYRTLREISGWSRSGAAAQRLLWQTIIERSADRPD